MKYYETVFNTVIKKDMDVHNSCEMISSGINFCLNLNERTKELHLRKGIKGYCFFVEGFRPFKTGRITNLVIRCFDPQMMEDFIEALLMRDTEVFMCQDIVSKNEYEYTNLIKRYAMKTISPVVLTETNPEFNNKEELINRIGNNLSKKYCMATGENIIHNPIADAKQISKKLAVANYKGGNIIGRKVLVKFKTDELSQKMAFVAMAYGLGEKNSLGFGFCKADNDYLYDF